MPFSTTPEVEGNKRQEVTRKAQGHTKEQSQLSGPQEQLEAGLLVEEGKSRLWEWRSGNRRCLGLRAVTEPSLTSLCLPQFPMGLLAAVTSNYA